MPSSTLEPDQLAELVAIRARYASPAAFAQWGSEGRWRPTEHLAYLDKILATVATGPRRIILSTPPRHGKTQLASHWLPAWYLAKFPWKRVLHTSYEAGFAIRIGSRRVRDTLLRLAPETGVGIVGGSAAPQTDWQTTAGGSPTDEGGMVSVGMGGALTGRGGHLMIIDDPIKNAQDAWSPTIRENHIDWWSSTASTRVEPGGSVVCIMTRWHEADLVGHLLEAEGGQWQVVNLPALAVPGDPLEREVGAALWPERYPVDYLSRVRANIGEMWWNGLYMGNPRGGDGAVFRRDDFRLATVEGTTVTLHAREGKRVWDLSALRFVVAADTAMRAAETSDYTVIATLAITPCGCVVVWDIHRARIPVPDQWPAIKAAIKKYNPIRAGVEAKASGIGIAEQAKREKIRLDELAADVDKGLRAVPLANAYQAERVFHLSGASWLDTLERELLGFPVGQHDDQVDALAHGFGLAAPLLVDARNPRATSRPPIDPDQARYFDQSRGGASSYPGRTIRKR